MTTPTIAAITNGSGMPSTLFPPMARKFGETFSNSVAPSEYSCAMPNRIEPVPSVTISELKLSFATSTPLTRPTTADTTTATSTAAHTGHSW